jgi:hypothetical protein
VPNMTIVAALCSFDSPLSVQRICARTDSQVGFGSEVELTGL